MANSSSFRPSLPSWAPQWTLAAISTSAATPDSTTDSTPPAAWHILGAGAIGQLLATKFVEAGFDITLVGRSQPQPARATQIVQRVHLGESKTFTLACEPTNVASPIQHLLVTTKSNQVLQALEDVGPRLNAASTIVLLHNGMGTLEPAQELFSPTQIYCGVTTQGAYQQVQPNVADAHDTGKTLVYAGKGTTELGQPGQPIAPAWVQPLLDSSLGFSWHSNIETVLWRKLLINCAINPLTAIHNCRNGELLSDPAIQVQLRSVVSELTAVAHSAGYQRLAKNLFDTVAQVITSTQDNYASMQQDLQHGRATEIAYINGYLCKQARQHGVATPMNDGLVAAIQHLEQGLDQTQS